MERIDQLLVKLNKAETRSKAKALILSGYVYINNKRIEKAGLMVDENAQIEVKYPGGKYVSRGGYKLEAALKYFNILVSDKIALDAGASTGGFTDCLLQFGAKEVIAIDVGYGQLDYRLQKDQRVIPIFRRNVRYIKHDDVGKRCDIITLDLSFISLRKVLLPLKKLLNHKGYILALVKPQFEAGPEYVQKGGVIKDSAIHKKVINDVIEYAESINLNILGSFASPLLGPKGNREFFLLMTQKENKPTSNQIESES